MNSVKITMPVSALLVDGDGSEPGPGDVVELRGEGRVEMTADGKARLVVETLNGVAPEPAETEPPGESSDDDESLESAAKKADEAAYL